MNSSIEKPAFGLADLDLAPADRSTLVDFLESWLAHGRPVLFAGAGMSRHNAVRRPDAPTSAEIKDWRGLVDGLRARLAAGDASVLGRLPSDYLRLAQLHETQFQRVRLLDAVEEALANAHFDPGPAHFRLKRFQWEAIITTNYDDLIERAFANDQTRPLVKIVWDADLTRRRPVGTLLLVKMHGDIHDRNSIVLTEEDYRCYEQSRPGVALKVKQLLLEHPSLFVGFSLSDPNVGAIEGWIRDASGRLKLPSVVLVHGEPLDAERDMWGRRGIKLVHVRRGESLTRFFDALHGERARRSKHQNASRDAVHNREMDTILEQRRPGWEADAAHLLLKLADGAHEPEFAGAVRFTLQGGVRNVAAESIQKILEALPSASQRVVLLRAHAHGVLKAAGSGVIVLDIEDHLLNDPGLSATERATVLIGRAIREQQDRKLPEARETLLAARALAPDDATRERIKKQLRDVLLRIGDEHGIGQELLDSPLPKDSVAYARRGSDALLTKGRTAATRWYAEALECARDGDEKHAALAGLWACVDPGDWSRLHEIDTQRRAILREERPKTQRAYDLQDEAGAKLLKIYSSGARKQSHDVRSAIEKLQEALAEADDMGWPRSVIPNLTTAADGFAYAVVGLLLMNESSSEQILQALEFAIERGLLKIDSHFDDAAFDRLVAVPQSLGRAKVLIQPREEAAFMARTRSLLRSALLSLMTDDAITAHVTASIDASDLSERSFHEKSATESHLELLRRHHMAMPRAAAEHLVRCFATVMRGDDVSLLRADWLRAPLTEWVKTGVIQAEDEAVRELLAALKDLFDRGVVRTDTFVRLNVMRWLEEFAEADLLSLSSKQAFASLLDSELEHALNPAGQELDVLSILDLALARAEFHPWTPPTAARDVFLASYAKLNNSTGIGRWSAALGIFANGLTEEARGDIAKSVVAYADSTLADGYRIIGPFPQGAADAVSKAARAGILPSAEALALIRALGAKYAEVLWRAVEIPGVDLEAEVENILAAQETEGNGNDLSGLLLCQELSRSSASRHLERIAMGELNARNARSRQLAYWCGAALARNGNLSDVGCQTLAEAIGKFGALDRDWRVRMAAIGTATQVLGSFARATLDALVDRGASDPIARVRRASDLLRRASHSRTSG